MVTAATSRAHGFTHLEVPRVFQFGVLLFLLLTGSFPLVLQLAIFGMMQPSSLGIGAAIVTSAIYDILRVAPLVVLARHREGILHPVNLAVVVWPLLTSLPLLIDNFGGYAGIIGGEPVRAPYYQAISWFSFEDVWLSVAYLNLLQIVSLLSLYAGFAFVKRHDGRSISRLRHLNTRRLRAILVGIILMNFVAVAVFVQLRGGLVEHIYELAFGRFRALEGLGPLLALFDIGFVAVLVWICYRPQDARSPLFIVFTLLVMAQQFVVAGSRSSILLVAVTVVLGWSVASQRIPWRIGLFLVPIAFLSLGALNIIRTAGLSDTTAIEAVGNTDLAAIAERSRAEFELREAVSGPVPVIADSMRSTGPQWGYTYVGAVAAFIPRAVWPDKPRGPGSLYAQQFLGEDVEGTAVPIGPVAEAYWNFHVPGVIVLFLIYGILLRKIFELLTANRRHGMIIAGFVLFVSQFGVSTDQLVASQQTFLVFVLLLAIIYVFYRDAFRSAAENDAVRRSSDNSSTFPEGTP